MLAPMMSFNGKFTLLRSDLWPTRQTQKVLEVRTHLPKQHLPAKGMHKTRPLRIDENVKEKDNSGYKAWRNFASVSDASQQS